MKEFGQDGCIKCGLMEIKDGICSKCGAKQPGDLNPKRMKTDDMYSSSDSRNAFHCLDTGQTVIHDSITGTTIIKGSDKL